MEKEFNISIMYETILDELREWYGNQGFEVLNKIHDVSLFDVPEIELQDVLEELWKDWEDLSVDCKVEIYNDITK